MKRSRLGLTFCLLVCAIAFASDSADTGLADELRQRSSEDGLALIRIQSNWIELVPFDADAVDLPNTRDLSTGYFSSSAGFVAWHMNLYVSSGFSDCSSPVRVESVLGKQLGRLPGNVINIAALAISSDGKKVAFDGTYKPQGTGVLNTARNRARWVQGLQYGEIGGQAPRPVLEAQDETIHSISWSPDGSAFAFEYHGQIWIYGVTKGKSRALTVGSTPTWSPNGAWLAFRTSKGEAALLDPSTGLTRRIIPGHKILWAVHWSPDSQYIAYAERIRSRPKITSPSAQLVVHRLRDGASTPVKSFSFKGGDDRGFYWIKDYKNFLGTLPRKLEIRPPIPSEERCRASEEEFSRPPLP